MGTSINTNTGLVLTLFEQRTPVIITCKIQILLWIAWNRTQGQLWHVGMTPQAF